MKEILFSFVLMIVGIAAIVMGGAKYSQWLLSHMVGSRLVEAQSILETGRPPESWRRAWRRAHWWVRNPAKRALHIAANDINHLTRLMRLFESSPAFDDADVREAMLDGLEAIQQEWHRTYQKMLGAG